MKKWYKYLAFVLAIVMAVTHTQWGSNVTGLVAKVKDVIYIDGTKLSYEMEADGVTLSSGKSSLTIQDDHTGTAHIVNDDSVEDFELNIVDLSRDAVYVVATNKKTGEQFTIDHLGDESTSYTGQAAIALTGSAAIYLSLQTFLYYMILVGLTIVVAGVVYYAIDKAIVKIRQNKEHSQSKYYPAKLSGKMVYIAMKNPISLSQASTRIRRGQDIYTYFSGNAKKAVLGSGLGSWYKSEIDQKRKKGYIYFYHWHTANRNGAHAWFGNPIWG